MKIAISAEDKNINSNVSDIFGRCPYFIIAEINDKKVEKTEVIKNESLNEASGAGVLTARLMAEKNVQALIAKNIGPRALDVLKQFKIEIYFGQGIINEVIQKFIDEKLKKIN